MIKTTNGRLELRRRKGESIFASGRRGGGKSDSTLCEGIDYLLIHDNDCRLGSSEKWINLKKTYIRIKMDSLI